LSLDLIWGSANAAAVPVQDHERSVVEVLERTQEVRSLAQDTGVVQRVRVDVEGYGLDSGLLGVGEHPSDRELHLLISCERHQILCWV
jgi:hypothetical protein